VYKLADLGFAKDGSQEAVCHTRLGTYFYIVSCLYYSVRTNIAKLWARCKCVQ